MGRLYKNDEKGVKWGKSHDQGIPLFAGDTASIWKRKKLKKNGGGGQKVARRDEVR